MPSERKTKREFDISIYSNNDDLHDVLKALKDESRLTYRKLLRQMIEQVSASERLRKKVLDHYNAYGATWADDGSRKEVRITLDEPTYHLATALAFHLCGNGKLSELGRLLIRFYAAEGNSVRKYVKSTDRISIEVVQTSRPKRSNVVSIRSRGKKSAGKPDIPTPKTPTSVTLDEETVPLLGMLVQSMQMRNNELVSHLVEKYAANEHKLKELHKSPAWEDQISGNTVIKRFNFDEQIEHLMTSVTFRATGTTNKSAMIRAFIRIEADLRGLSVTTPNRGRANS